MSIYFIPIVTLLGAALFRYRSIRALCRPISPCGLNTGFWLRLLPVGQYAFAVALFRPAGSIRAFGYGYCPLGNTPSRSPYFALWAQYGLLSPGVALRLPRAVFWRPIRALYFPFPKPHICRRQMSIPPPQTSHLPQADVNSPAPNLTSAAGRCQFPLSIYGEGVRG